MGTFVLGVMAAMALIGWLSQKISTMILLWYLAEKEIPFPSEEEIKRGGRWVVSHMVRDLLPFVGKR